MVVAFLVQYARAWIDCQTGCLAVVFIASAQCAEWRRDLGALSFGSFVPIVPVAPGFADGASANGQGEGKKKSRTCDANETGHHGPASSSLTRCHDRALQAGPAVRDARDRHRTVSVDSDLAEQGPRSRRLRDTDDRVGAKIILHLRERRRNVRTSHRYNRRPFTRSLQDPVHQPRLRFRQTDRAVRLAISDDYLALAGGVFVYRHHDLLRLLYPRQHRVGHCCRVPWVYVDYGRARHPGLQLAL